MQRRVAELAPGERVWVSTFHRFGARLLRQYAEFVGLAPNFTIYDTNDVAADDQARDRSPRASRRSTTRPTGSPRRSARRRTSSSRPTGTSRKPGSTLSHVVAEVYPRVSGAAARVVGRRLRRPAAARRPAALRPRRSSRRARRALPLRAGRRIPGHEPRAVRDPARPVDATIRTWP